MGSGVASKDGPGVPEVPIELERFAALLQSLSPQDKVDLFDLFVAIPTFMDDQDQMSSAARAVREVVSRKREDVRTVPMFDPPRKGRPAKLQNWVDWISGRVQNLREKKGWTQEVLASRSGLPQSHISRIEGGKLSPSRKTVEKLARALGVRLAVLDPSED